MKPRKILHVTRVHNYGAAIVVDRLVRGLNRDCYEPIVAFDTSEQSNIRKKLSKSDIKTIDLRKSSGEHASWSSIASRSRDISKWFESHFGKSASEIYLSMKYILEFLLHEAPKIRLFVRVIRENDINIVHTHSDLHHCKPEVIAAQIIGVPCISHIHGYPIYTFFDRIFSRFVTSFIYISRDVAKYHRAQGKPKVNGIIIHNGVDMKEFQAAYDTGSVRSEFNLKADDILIGLIGRVDWWKGHEYFLEAMAEVSIFVPTLKALIIGEPNKLDLNRPYLIKLQALIKSLNLSDKVIFTGFRSDIPRLMAALDLVVHASSIPEPFGLVVIEGMAVGKPVVATAAGGVLDIIEDGVNGLLVPCKDSKAMAMAILKIISNQENAIRMGLAACQRIIEKFTVQHQVTAIQKLYDSLLAYHG